MIKFFNALQTICYTLVIVGAINWGLIGVFGFNLVEYLFGTGLLARIVYIVVGASAILSLILTVRYTMECREDY